MSPTLNKDAYSDSYDGAFYYFNVNFGYVDQHKDAKESIRRFDIVTTFYPWDNNDYDLPYERGDKKLATAYYKIKRVIAMPGDTFKIVNNELFLKNEEDEWVQEEMDFLDHVTTVRNQEETEVGEGEYWVAGDNWGHSTDSFNHVGTNPKVGPVYYENITGVLVAIQGTCTVKKVLGKDDVFLNHRYYSKPIYFF